MKDNNNRRKVLPKPLQALLQSAFAGLFVLGSFYAVYGLHSKLAIASLAASAFIAFVYPTTASANGKVLLGGYGCAVICGGLCFYLLHLLAPARCEEVPIIILFCSLSVFLTAFSMALLKVQHPPAAALAVSMVLEPHPVRMGITMLLCALALVGLKTLVSKTVGRYYG